MNPMNNAAVAYVHHDHNRLNGNPGIAVEVRVQLVSVGAPLGIVMRLQSDDVGYPLECLGRIRYSGSINLAGLR